MFRSRHVTTAFSAFFSTFVLFYVLIAYSNFARRKPLKNGKIIYVNSSNCRHIRKLRFPSEFRIFLKKLNCTYTKITLNL